MRDRKLDMGHARAILSVEDPKIQLKLYKQVIKEGLSVRAVEELGRKLAEGENHDAPAKVKVRNPPTSVCLRKTSQAISRCL